MPRGTGWLSVVGLLGLAVVADAQTPLISARWLTI